MLNVSGDNCHLPFTVCAWCVIFQSLAAALSLRAECNQNIENIDKQNIIAISVYIDTLFVDLVHWSQGGERQQKSGPPPPSRPLPASRQ